MNRAPLYPLLAITAALAALAVYGCGSTAPTPPGLAISGAGLSTSPPAWPHEYSHLAQRVSEMRLPPSGDEKFHIHAMLHIYNQGLLVTVPANVGIDPAQHIESSLHTHDGTGIIHMEAAHAYPFTLGDFFKVWGVKLGPAQVGGLRGLGGDRLHFYVNGQPFSDPASHVLHNGDSIVIGYGTPTSFTHAPSTVLLKEVEAGKGGLSCTSSPETKKSRSCLTTTKSNERART